MIVRLLLLIGLPVLVYFFIRDVSRRFQLTQRQMRYLYVFTVALLIVGVLIALGRLPAQFILAPLGVAATFLLRALPTLLRLLPMWQMFKGSLNSSKNKSSSGNSSIRTDYLVMSLDHDSGAMDGEVIAGEFSGQQLSALSLPQLLQLLREVAADGDSVQVLQAYMDREHEQWREQAGADTGAYSGEAEVDPAMTEALALEILGLSGTPDKKQIHEAHRRLMRQLHPDRGGSDYFAKKLNLAKDFLLAQLGRAGQS